MRKIHVKKFPIILILAIFLIGAGLMAYPAISNYLTELSQGEVIREYQENLERMDEEQKEQIRRQAEEYNQNLIGNVVLTDPFDESNLAIQNTQYQDLLNPNGDGVMGYLEIPSIGVFLGVYHGTDVEVMKVGAGHLMNTSLPVGGLGSHAVLSAHSGLPSAMLFTDLNKLEKNDKFYLYILGETMAYEINQIKVVEPHEIDDLFIDIKEDYVTLVTCTPYGVNSHRLLVRGTRVAYVEEEKEVIEKKQEASGLMNAYLILIPIGIIFLIIVIKKK